jgi:hypothetical protein
MNYGNALKARYGKPTNNKDELFLLIEFIAKREDIPKRDRALFLFEIIRAGSSLRVVAMAGSHFQRLTGDNLKPLFIEGHLNWWKEHQDSFK